MDTLLVARSFTSGRAVRSAKLRHRRLCKNPIAIVLWQMGGEPFSAAAIAWGVRADQFDLAVAGDPRNRDLGFAALLRFARWFKVVFEKPIEGVDLRDKDDLPEAPQIIVANDTTIEMIGRLGRRLAYLKTDGQGAADPALVHLGRHLQFLHRVSDVPGQQLIVSMTDLLKRHWTTAQSPEERASLAAFDAWINPPKGVSAFDAAAAGERIPIGPVPTRDEDTALEKLLETFNRQRGDKTDAATIARLIPPIEAHYRRLVAETWKLLWRCRDRELSNSEAPSVDRRWEEDCRAYKDHMKWQRQDGRTRTRQTARQAAQMMKERERAQQLLDAEEACEDSLKMLPHILANRAVFGKVVSVDREHKERGPKNMVRRPLIVLESPDPCLIPRGKKLYWTRLPKMACELVGVQHLKDGRSRVTLKVLTGTPKELPSPNSDACFSVLTTDVFFSQPLPREAPWPHAALASVPLSIEDS